MILKDTFTREHLDSILKIYKCDPIILEKAIVCLGLVESLVRVGCDFVFKGGSSLMILLDDIYRLSTDCDIVVPLDYDIDLYLKKASLIFPFVSFSESIRKTNKNISKKHYKFVYKSFYNDKGFVTIILDVVFENLIYKKIVKKEIKNKLLNCDDKSIYVNYPSVEAILGDKITAFAPNTTGIRFFNEDFSNDKKLEVIKQFFDIANLVRCSIKFEDINENFLIVSKIEISYRNLNISPFEVLFDTFDSALSIFSKGKINPKNYKYFLEGIKKIRNHIFGRCFSGESAIFFAADVMLITAGLIKNVNVLSITIPNQAPFNDIVYKNINYVIKISRDVFNKAAFAIRLIYS